MNRGRQMCCLLNHKNQIRDPLHPPNRQQTVEVTDGTTLHQKLWIRVDEVTRQAIPHTHKGLLHIGDDVSTGTGA